MRWLLPLLATLSLAGAPTGPLPTGGAVASVYDGDTLTMASGDKIRLKWANTPELKPMEPYGIEARDAARRFLDGKEVTLTVNPETARDGYGRVLASVATQTGDLSVYLLEEGLAHVFVIPPLDGDPAPYLEAQARAQAKGIGLWSTDRYRNGLHITSFHANAPGDESLDPNLEYVRVCNVAAGPVDLAGYVVEDADGNKFTLPSFVVPVGHTVKLHSGKGVPQADPAQQLAVHLGSAEPIWGNDYDRITIKAPDGQVVDAREHKVKK